jgi:uncharacterized protein (DUF433 family)
MRRPILYSGARSILMTQPRITSDPAIMMGKPCVRGTRVTVETILRLLAAGHAVGDILAAYPQLTADDIQSALKFAADYLQHETVSAAE